MRWVSLFVLVACGSDAAIAPASIERESLTATPGGAPAETLKASSVTRLVRSGGSVVALTADGSFLAAGASGREPTLIDKAPKLAGALGFAASRNGFAAWSSNEIFLGDTKGVARSTLSDFFKTRSVRWVDATTETLWLTASDGVFFSRAGVTSEVKLSSGTALDFAIAEDTDRALLFSSDGVWAAKPPEDLKRLGDSIGKVFGSDRGADGTVYIASESGVLVSSAGTRVLLGLSSAPRSLSAGPTGVTVLVGNQVVELTRAPGASWTAKGIGQALDTDRSLATDADGNVWLAAEAPQNPLRYLAIGKPVSFDVTIKPLVQARCQKCHDGSKGPKLAFDSYEIAKSNAEKMGKRVRGEGAALMPPPSEGALAPEAYKDLLRWVAGGAKP
jgi:hypothetical protein